jgi:hypothetical protein
LEIRAIFGKDIQLDLFETAHIRLEVPRRKNQKDFKPQFKPFEKTQKKSGNFVLSIG